MKFVFDQRTNLEQDLLELDQCFGLLSRLTCEESYLVAGLDTVRSLLEPGWCFEWSRPICEESSEADLEYATDHLENDQRCGRRV